ncbi:MAG TPA: hypothetical protein VMY06_00490 [Sedimentisphaerales bacterium]|nr:hypothetical protein [Sedimentisphaerales bacterium]
MSEDENQNNKKNDLNVNVSDGIKISEDITVEPSDITVTARSEDNEEKKIIFSQAVSSEVIAQDLSDALCISGDDSAPFQDLIKEWIEYVKKEPWEGKMGLNLPLDKIHPRLPNINWSFEFRTGQKTTIKKYTSKRQQKSSNGGMK